MGLRRQNPSIRHDEAVHDALLHLGSRLIGEGDRNDLLGCLHGVKELEIALR